MLGYYKDEKLTNEVIVDHYHTGDIGSLMKTASKITDRKRNVQNLRGKYIAPQLIENTMKQSRFIEQIIVIGEGQKWQPQLFNLTLNS
jgi:long-chain acyl-CoA synthetase